MRWPLAGRRWRPSAGEWAALALAGLIAWGAPKVVRVRSAADWARYHAAQPPASSGEHAEGAARWASVLLREAAPLPWGVRAGWLAFEVGGRHESRHPEEALALYRSLRETLEGLPAWRRLGTAVLLDEVRRREQVLGARDAASADHGDV